MRLAQAWPRLLPLVLVACASAYVKPAAYGVELQDCTRTSTTLAASLDCEDSVRARYGRPPLTAEERAERHPRDGGTDGDR